ncbi:MAG TPA: hypothetical protein VF172_05105 [Nitrososphaera sp.]|jgi:hypothetical protein
MQKACQQTGAMTDKARTSYTVIPISRPVLADLCGAIDRELEKTKQDRSLAIYEIVSRKQHVQTHDSKSFLAYDIPGDLSSIFLRLQAPHRRIMIKVSPRKNDSYVIIEGSDSEWVRSTTQAIGNIIEAHKASCAANDGRPLLARIKSIMLRVCIGVLLWAMLLGNAG